MQNLSVLLEDESLPSIDVQPEFKTPEFGFGYIESEPWVLVLVLLGIIALIALPIIIMNIIRYRRTGKRFEFTVRDLTFGAICLATSYVLSFFGVGLNLGGTITFASILPISIYCYYFGFEKGALVSAVFMLLQFTQQPYIVSPWSMLLDYVIPYLALSASGLFAYNGKQKNATGSKRFALLANKGYYVGMLIYVVIRYASHIMSGILFWDLWYGEAPFGFIVGYSFAYNSFCVIDWGIAVLASLALLSSKNFDRLMKDSFRARNASKQSANGCVGTQSDGFTNADTCAENDDSARTGTDKG